MAGNSDLVHLLAAIKGYYDYGIFQAIQIATVIALRHCEEDMQAQAKVYEQRRDVLCEGLTRIGWEVEKPRATMFVWTKIPAQYKKMGSVEFSKMLITKAKVAVSPGIGFGEYGDDYVRFALVENPHRTRQAIRGIKQLF